MGRVSVVWVVMAASLGCDALDGPAVVCGADVPCPEGAVCRRGFCVVGPLEVEACLGTDAMVGGPCVPPGASEWLVFGASSVCQQGTWMCDADAGLLVCEGFMGPEGAETCDGRDEDCDGMVDEDTSPEMPCFESAAGVLHEGMAGIPPCQPGVMRCVGGALVCDGLVVPEVIDRCNGIDDDCDGAMDEDDEGRVCEPDDAGGMSGDLCPTGNLLCERVGGEFIAVCRAAIRGEEVCDRLDNDCDGVVDEPFRPAVLRERGLGQTCEVGVRACRRQGVYECGDRDGDGDGTQCSVTASEPGIELCEGLVDEDCDGAVDEDYRDPNGMDDEIDGVGEDCAVGRGACLRTGTFVCDVVNQRRTICSAVPGVAAAEVCDKLHESEADDDCDGVVDEGCACNPRGQDEGEPVILDEAVPQGRGYSLPDLTGAAVDPQGLGASCTGQAPGVEPRDEMALVWRPRPGGLVRVEVSSDTFDPRAYVAPLCRVGEPVGLAGEIACGLDAGLSRSVGDSHEGKAARTVSMVMRVPGQAPGEVGVFVESTAPGVATGDFRVEISDPRGGGACAKVLAFGEGGQRREVSGMAMCRKRLTNALIGPPGAAGFTLVQAEGPSPAPFDGAGRWDDPRFCVDNDGRARSVEVDWSDLTDANGVEGVMLPVGEERGDWWSTTVMDGSDFVFISVEPLGIAAADAPCLANSVRLLAWLTCDGELAGMQAMAAGRNCVPAGANTMLVCDPGLADIDRLTCVALGGAGPQLPRRDLNLSNIDDAGCLPGGQLVLHIGVVRENDRGVSGIEPDRAPPPCGDCRGVTIPPGDCFRYRLRVRRP